MAFIAIPDSRLMNKKAFFMLFEGIFMAFSANKRLAVVEKLLSIPRMGTMAVNAAVAAIVSQVVMGH